MSSEVTVVAPCEVEWLTLRGGARLDASVTAVCCLRFWFASCLCLVTWAAAFLAVAAGFEELGSVDPDGALLEFLVVLGAGVTQRE